MTWVGVGMMEVGVGMMREGEGMTAGCGGLDSRLRGNDETPGEWRQDAGDRFPPSRE